MPAAATIEQFLETVRKSGLIDEKALSDYVESLRAAGTLPDTPSELAQAMVRDGLLTRFQAGQLLEGKTRGFVLNAKYKLLEHLGTGGMGTVYLCEHTSMRRRVAIKVLPVAKAKDPSYLERFYREARAVAALDHPNIVRAHDIDRDEKLHFLVMEYIDGASLQEIVGKHGPLDPVRAAHYIAQAALGLQHAHEGGLVHRDIKPGNLLVDRGGTVKVLDMGLARFFHDDDNLSKKYDETVLGTSDYLAPEQTIASDVDIRADIYSLGATFYFCLTGQTLFGEGTAAQKLIWHTTRQPKSIRATQPEVPEEMAELVEQKMLAKDPANRFQEPIEVFEALQAWTATAIPPPPEDEMPKLSRAAAGPGEASSGPITPGSLGSAGSASRRGWTVSGSGSPRPSRNPATTRRTAASGPKSGTAPSTRVGGRNGPPTAAPGSGKGKGSGIKGAGSGSKSRRLSNVDITEAPTDVRPSGSKPLLPGSPPGESPDVSAAPIGARLLVLLAAAVVGPVLLAGLAAGVWWHYWRSPTPKNEPPAWTPPQQNQPQGGTAGVAIQVNRGVHQVQAPRYEAFIESDGCLTSLRVGGVEFLHGGGKARGSYFTRPGGDPLKLTTIDKRSGSSLRVRGKEAEIIYEFGRDTLNCIAINTSPEPLTFHVVLDPDVKVVGNDKNEWARVPVVRNWPTTVAFAGRARLRLSGGNGLRADAGNAQAWEVDLKPDEYRRLSLQVGDALPAELAQVRQALWEHPVHTPAYDAVVAGDGCLTSLRLGGTEVLWVGKSISRGVYFLQGPNGTLRLPDVEEKGQDAVTAKSDTASIRYEFGPDTLTWYVSNKTDKPLSFFMVFGPTVTAVTDGKDWAKTPTNRDWKTTTWFAGKSKLTVTGGAKLWGPWSEDPRSQPCQVWDGSLAPKETRKVVLKVEPMTGAEAARVASLTGVRPDVETELELAAPLEYQVCQRYSRSRGQLPLRGKVRPECDKVRVRVTGQSPDGPLPDGWKNVPFDNKANRTFDTLLPEPAGGWYKVEVQALKGDKVVAETTVDRVGVGEVFVIAGQSNATNCGEEQLKTQTGMVASFSGENWQPGDDPQPGVHDKTGGGSCWPAFGDALYEKYHVPIGIASTGHSGSSIKAWQPGPKGDLFNWMMARTHQLGAQGFRAVLWHQGETDVGLSADEYGRLLTNVIAASKKEAGWDFPWFVAQVSYHNPEHPSYPSTREGQKQLWDKGVALEGPDTDTLTGDNRDGGGKGIHFSGKGERAHGKLWADKVSVYLDKVE
jgi:serine/threonine protein kinase